MRNLERLLETWMGEEEGKRMKSLIVRLAKDESGNNLLHFSESESEDSGKEKEKGRKNSGQKKGVQEAGGVMLKKGSTITD